MFDCSRKDMQSVASVMKKLVGKYRDVYLLTDEMNLYLIVNTTTYLKVVIPATVTEKNRCVQLDAATFESLLNLRGENLKTKIDFERKNMIVQSGTKAELHINPKVSKDDYAEPSFKSDHFIKLDARSVATFRQYITPVTFSSPDEGDHSFSQVVSSSKNFAIYNGSPNLVSFVKYKPIKGLDFNICISNKIKEVLKLAVEDIELCISENTMMVRSNEITCTLPCVQDDEFLGYIEVFKVMLKDNPKMIEGCATFNAKDFNNVLTSVRSISQGTDILSMTFKNNKVLLSQSSNIGKSTDVVEGNVTFKEKVNVEIPERFFASALSILTTTFSKDCEFSILFPDAKNYFVVKAKGEGYIFTCVGPTV